MDKCIQTEPEDYTGLNFHQRPPETPVRNSFHYVSPHLDTPFLQSSPFLPDAYPPPPLYYWQGPPIPFLHNTPQLFTPQAQPKHSEGNQGQGSQGQKKDAKRLWQTGKDKIEEIFALLSKWKWSIGDLFLHMFFMEDTHGKSFEPSPRHVQVIAKFLAGETKIGVSRLIEAWMKSAYGLPSEQDYERQMFYSTTVDYRTIKHARPAITSFAAQVIKEKLVKEARKVVKSESGLHTFTSKGKDISRYDLGERALPEAMAVFQETTPLTWEYVLVIAMPNKEAEDRERRPPAIVAAHAMSMLAYSRNLYAKLVALEKGILNFACCANHYLYKYDSRVGGGPSYHSVCEALKKLAANDARIIREISWSQNSSWILRFDNVQHYVRPRNFRVGKEATMKIGTAGTVFEFVNFSSVALDINEKKKKLAENKRKDLTFPQLMALIDTNHIHKVLILQFLRILINYVPCLHKYKANVRKQYNTNAVKKQLPLRKTRLFPLPTNGRNETITAELMHALLDFIKEMGYTEDAYIYMQFHDTPFQRLDWLQPFLETWHACWTDLCRIFEAHWDSLLSPDPSSIGHSANHLKRKAPSNLKKVDYYPYSELAYQVLDARILDCWRIYLAGKDGDLLQYFEKKEVEKNLPSFKELHEMACILFNRYGHPHAFERAMKGAYKDPKKTVAMGDAWTRTPHDESSTQLNGNKAKATKKKKKAAEEQEDEPSPPFEGDQTLAQSCRFIYDAAVSREVIYATADGDVGRVWEALKSMILTFAGSTHSKYMNYLLEMLCDLELESSKELREAFLSNWIINPSGEAGRFVAGDKFQEQLQDEMYEHIGRKDRGFDEDYMRKVIAPNAYRFVLVKKTITQGLGLAKRGYKHSEPHTNPEMAKLLQVYQNEQLHLFRKGRTYGGDPRKTDDLGRGVQRLMEGKLAAWVRDTTRTRIVNKSAPPEVVERELTELETAMDALDEEINIQQNQEAAETRTAGQVLQLADGELVFEYEGDVDEGDDEPEGLIDISNYDVDTE
ncbi:hypothetical protein BDZ97DRAFT_1759423 [Flammula alnicola]|nr:hypothetical protein BDZ97DRAFT_1759423 [Flammula alnicola]